MNPDQAKGLEPQSKKKTSNKKKSSARIKNNEQINETLRNEISSLSYEETLKKLDTVLDILESDNFSLQDLQTYYLEGQTYIEHCEKLLANAEQLVCEVDLDDST